MINLKLLPVYIARKFNLKKQGRFKNVKEISEWKEKGGGSKLLIVNPYICT